MQKKTLYEYLKEFQKTVENKYVSSEWVSLEILNINMKAGHYYIEITDQDENGNKLRSQNAIIYKSKVINTIEKFELITGLKLNKGMRVLVKLKLTFTTAYGISFIIEDIDPAFTLGEIEIKINNIRKEIYLKGESLKNKSLITPIHFTKIAVIAPESAAGLGDFNAEAKFLKENNLCEFKYFYATFEGENTENSIKNAFTQVNESNKLENYDVVVIIRGGGSKSSLNYLNELIIARCVCRLPIPVFSGIGHEIDKVLIDEYANRSFDTPSKVIEYISNTIFNNYLRASENIKIVNLNIHKTIDGSLNKIKLLKNDINQKIDITLKTRMQDLDLNIFNIHAFINNNIIEFKNRTQNYREFIENSLLNKVNTSIENIKRENKDINFLIDNILLNKKNEILDIKKIIDIYHPRYTIERGFGVLRKNNQIIKDINDIKNEDYIEIELKNGKKIFKIGEVK